jgi:hypothetical protein
MKIDRRTMADRRKHPDGSDCPLNHDSVEKLLGTLDSIDHIGHAVVWTVGIMAGAFWWLHEHIDNVRLIIKDFIK